MGSPRERWRLKTFASRNLRTGLSRTSVSRCGTTLRPRSRDRYLVMMSTRKLRQQEDAVFYTAFSCAPHIPRTVTFVAPACVP